MAGVAWFVFSLPHLIFHLGHLEGLTTFDKIGEAGSLAVTLVIAGLLALPTRARAG